MGQEQQEVIEQLYACEASKGPGEHIIERFEASCQDVEEQNASVITKVHAGREFYVNEANAEVYEALMGKEPLEFSGKQYSEIASRHGMEFLKSVDFELNTGHLERYKSILDEKQADIDEKLARLEIFDVPKSADELEKELEYLASESGVNLASLQKIKQAQRADKVLKAYSDIGIELPKIKAKQNAQDKIERIERLSRQDGVSKIQAGLLVEKME